MIKNDMVGICNELLDDNYVDSIDLSEVIGVVTEAKIDELLDRYCPTIRNASNAAPGGQPVAGNGFIPDCANDGVSGPCASCDGC